MKGFKKIAFVFFFFAISTTALATKTKFDPTIYYDELQTAGIHNVRKVQSNLGLDNNKKQELVIKHVITTGRNQANRNYIIIDIATLEKIQPQAATTTIIKRGQQVALTDDQVKSIMDIASDNDNAKKWLDNTHMKKYINIVLQRKDATDNKISPVSASEARSLVQWAIKNKHLDIEDHPANTTKAS